MVFVILATCASSVYAGNWEHWRGDSGNGVATKASPPIKWSNSDNVQWKIAVPGKGSGSPVIWDDRVFVVSGVPVATKAQEANTEETADSPQRTEGRRRGRGSGREAAPLEELAFTLFCFDRATGKEMWNQVAVVAKPHEGTHSTNTFASASPCTDGELVFAHFGSRGLFCYTIDGKLKWEKDFGDMQTRATFGEGSSPVISGERIVVPWDHEGQSSIYCLNKRTGEVLWETKRDEPTCWATPLVIEHDGKQQVVMNGENKARAYDLETGEELWSCGGQTARPAASAVAGDGIVYIGSGFRGSFLGAFRPTGKGDIEGTDSVVWTTGQNTPDVASPLLSGDRLYFYKGKSGILTCVDAKTGELHYGPTRVPGLDTIYASPVAANGYVFLTARNGTTVVIKDANEFEIVGTNSVGETVDATPAPVDNQLFIRGENHLFCIAEN